MKRYPTWRHYIWHARNRLAGWLHEVIWTQKAIAWCHSHGHSYVESENPLSSHATVVCEACDCFKFVSNEDAA